MTHGSEALFPMRVYGVTVRRGGVEDAETLARLGAGLNAHQGDPVNHLTSSRIAQDLCNSDGEFVMLVARVGSSDVGYALYHTSYETAFAVPGFYVSDLYVDEACRGQKVGRALVAAIVRHAKKNQRLYLWWASKIWNKEAQRVYAAWGATSETIMAHALHGEVFDKFDVEIETLSG